LNTNLPGDLVRIRMDADEVVALVIRRRFVRKDVAAHQVALAPPKE
jgi:hypothetical protein